MQTKSFRWVDLTTVQIVEICYETKPIKHTKYYENCPGDTIFENQIMCINELLIKLTNWSIDVEL